MDRRRALLALAAGNALEWYDWIIYGLLAAWLGPQFFPSTDATSSTLTALAVFAVGFAARPLGGVLLGTIADRVGRRRVMLMSVAAMAISSLVIAVLPTYQQIGVWAGVILVICRIAQGLSTGAEAPLTATYVVELAPEGRQGRFGGVVALFVNFGIVLASLVTFLCSAWLGSENMANGGWRIPVLVGAVGGVVVLWMRRRLPETLRSGPSTPQGRTRAIWAEVWQNRMAMLAIIFVVAAAQVLNYGWVVGLPNLALTTYKENPTAIFGLSTLLGVMMMVLSLIGGWAADRWRLSRTFVALRLLAVPTTLLMLVYTSPGIGKYAVVLLGGGVVMGLNLAIYNVVTGTLMPAMARGTGVGIGYGIGVAAFGGTASYILLWLRSQGISWVFPIYVSVLCILSVLFYLAARKRGQVYVAE